MWGGGGRPSWGGGSNVATWKLRLRDPLITLLITKSIPVYDTIQVYPSSELVVTLEMQGLSSSRGVATCTHGTHVRTCKSRG